MTTIWMVLQFGFEMKPWWRRSASGLTSGTTSGTRGSMRKSAPLSTTKTPFSTAFQP